MQEYISKTVVRITSFRIRMESVEEKKRSENKAAIAAIKDRKLGYTNRAQLKETKSSPFFTVRFSVNEQMLFAKRLAFLVGAGVPLLEGLHVLKQQTKNPRTAKVYDSIISDVANGQFLSKSLSKFSRTFGAFTINIIKTGEQSGTLGQNLKYLSEELKKKYTLRKKIVGALVYPIIVTVATLGIAGLLTVYIFPKIMPIFTSLNVSLPLTTRVLLWISLFLKHNGIYVIIGLVLAIIGTGILRRSSPAFRMALDRIILAIPLSGKIALYYNMANFTRTLGLLLKSGLTLSEAVAVTGETMENRVYRGISAQIASELQTGKQLSTLMAARPTRFPPMTSHMIGIGERTGSLSSTCLYLSDMYEAEVDDLTKNLSQAIEPVLMVVMGIIVGFVAVSVITPIYEITQSLQR